MAKELVIMWFRQDLRLSDNPALISAANHGTVIPLYIFDDINPGEYLMGAASRCWLHHSLNSLNKSLNNRLLIKQGDPKSILNELIKKYDITAVYWNRCYQAWQIQRDKEIKSNLQNQGVAVTTTNGSLLWEPWDNLKNDGTPYKVFTPFYRHACQHAPLPRQPLASPSNLDLIKTQQPKNEIDQLQLLPKNPWGIELIEHWSIGEQAAMARFDSFIEHGFNYYKEARNFPAKDACSRLSPHLHFGEISPNTLWYEIKSLSDSENSATFLSELGWREFSYSLLYYNPGLSKINLQKKFDNFPWRKDKKNLGCWKQGLTGFPIVDAGMRELWKTGFMHNRVRMIVASFLIKNLLIHWTEGEAWFWDCLIDADLASNSASWQWVAGTGADAAPYFRIFNPVTQGQKFDPTGEYTKKHIPELSSMPIKYLFNPWEAPGALLSECGITLGMDYPEPIVDLKESRERALAGYQSIRSQ